MALVDEDVHIVQLLLGIGTFYMDCAQLEEAPTTTYSFSYGSFGLASSVKAGTKTLATYSYTNDRDFYLSALDYGNGDKVQYSYDDKGRVLSAAYEELRIFIRHNIYGLR